MAIDIQNADMKALEEILKGETSETVSNKLEATLLLAAVTLASDGLPEGLYLKTYEALATIASNVITALIGTQKVLTEKFPNEMRTFAVQVTVEELAKQLSAEVKPNASERMVSAALDGLSADEAAVLGLLLALQ